MDIDFSVMAVGDEVKLPAGKWVTVQPFFQAAQTYCKENPDRQFEFQGHDGSDFEKGQFSVKRVR